MNSKIDLANTGQTTDVFLVIVKDMRRDLRIALEETVKVWLISKRGSYKCMNLFTEFACKFFFILE